MAYAYEEHLGHYRHKPTLKYIKGKITPEHKNFDTWKRAALIADQVGVSYAVYIEAQFYWFDQWFNRPPKPWELSGLKSKFPAPERVRAFLKLSNPVKVQSVSQRSARIEPKHLDKINLARLAEVCRVWGLSEEEAMMRFARPGAGYFDIPWLRKHPVYKRLKKQKKL